MQACGINCLVVHFSVKMYDIWEGNMTIRSEIQIENIHSLELWNIREGVTLRRLILRSLECI